MSLSKRLTAAAYVTFLSCGVSPLRNYSFSGVLIDTVIFPVGVRDRDLRRVVISSS